MDRLRQQIDEADYDQRTGVRLHTSYHPARLLVSSALGGAVLLLAADVVLRLVSGGFELMLGVVTALIGAPFFFVLVLRERLGRA